MTGGLREKKQAQTKRAIYDAAMRLFAEQGFQETSVDQIAAAAEVAAPPFSTTLGRKTGCSITIASYSSSIWKRSSKKAKANRPRLLVSGDSLTAGSNISPSMSSRPGKFTSIPLPIRAACSTSPPLAAGFLPPFMRWSERDKRSVRSVAT